VPEGSYCFDPSQPLLRVIELFGSVYVEFNKLGKMQNRILSRQITVSDGHSRLLTFDLVATDGLPNNAAELIPPSDSTPYSSEDVSSLWTHGGLVKKEHPSYPAAAKAARISGLVLLDVMIGKDGHVRDIRVLDTPSPVLTEASERAVEQWQYDPAMVEGRPQELNTMINVIYSLSY
jgi:TonB family protein